MHDKLASLVNRCMEVRGNESDKLTVTARVQDLDPPTLPGEKSVVYAFSGFFHFNNLLSSVCSKALDI